MDEAVLHQQVVDGVELASRQPSALQQQVLEPHLQALLAALYVLHAHACCRWHMHLCCVHAGAWVVHAHE